MLKNVSDRCSRLENVAEKLSEKKTVIKEVIKEKVVNKKGTSSRHRVTWVGTSISKALDKNKFEHDTEVELTTEKAYCIKEEGRYPKDNFSAKVPEIVRKGDVDTLVLETGSLEITNMEVNKAMMDPHKDINEYKKEWFEKAEVASTELFKIAEDAIKADETIQVIILKRLPRFDRKLCDNIGIKSKLSNFANRVYDQL